MPRGPKGEKRPADVNAHAVMIAKIAAGEDRGRAADARIGGEPGRHYLEPHGGKAWAGGSQQKRRKEIARQATEKRWKSASLE
jgi:hypothetical protein